jgi:hypothetical protein
MTRDSSRFVALDTPVNRNVESVLDTTSNFARGTAVFFLTAANNDIWEHGRALHDLTHTNTVYFWRPTSDSNATWTNTHFVGGPVYNVANCR